ncbi:sensor histidine kinase [Cryptosporangium aurantiacum]|uniref:Two-component system, NarL family, sensor histidine kinase DesK n=1 Tax=Cryptosporangium aurantiacum TaxID=134849 RepID=A0A1M7RLW8_9ACTN|nr:histidine kinase [Cryptosporangium aurantiacum]SHN47078.1 two-component system, NarL family, sensor histidine kinase DesK [Cryptosporangium aurantiacum]
MSDAGTGLAGFRRYTWWAVPGTNVGVLILFTAEWVLDSDVPLQPRVFCAAALVVEVAAVLVLLDVRLRGTPARLPAGWPVAGVLAAIVLGVCPLALRNYGLWPVGPAIMMAVIATYLDRRARRRLVLTATAVAALPGGAVSLLAGDGQLVYAALFPVGVTAFTSWAVLGPLWAWDVAGRLEEARRLSAELAVKDERLRFAADLHDIQGHHLQVIAVKSELAARLAEADATRAAAEMEEVRRLATDALRDTREVVRGYRRTSLNEEITNATRVLASAGIDARTTVEPGAISESARHLLGLVMREAATNLLRHSRARTTSIEYRVADGVARLQVSNDGAFEPAADTGTGLSALAERLDAAGGVLEWTRDGERFELTACLPAGKETR